MDALRESRINDTRTEDLKLSSSRFMRFLVSLFYVSRVDLL